ncbi:hypothetical protein SASPL_123341 [Salvia splendens]|uniref:Uncharacterized protein n=1 Tax=Salvia splendens TaxID=180675 RepID=A0A8X8ZRZ5_SALSN|nr:hypothetical protein SASPL_123341 [Salvia splendens]
MDAMLAAIMANLDGMQSDVNKLKDDHRVLESCGGTRILTTKEVEEMKDGWSIEVDIIMAMGAWEYEGYDYANFKPVELQVRSSLEDESSTSSGSDKPLEPTKIEVCSLNLCD